jgi:hypothetical protein
MMNERNNLYKESFDNIEMVNKVFTDKFINFLTDYTKGFLVALKLDDNTYKYVSNIKAFDYTFKLYKIMFPELKIDLEKSQLIERTFREKNTKEALQLILENSKYIDNFVDFNVNFEKIICDNLSNFDIINKINQYNILTLNEINNIPKILNLNNKINEQVSNINDLIKEFNLLSTLKLKTIFIDSEYNNVKEELVKTNTFELVDDSELIKVDETKFKDSLTFERVKNLRDKGLYKNVDIDFSNLISEKAYKVKEESADYNAVLYNKHFNRLILCDYLNIWNNNILPEFEIVKKLSNIEYKQLLKHNKEELENYDESDNISDMSAFIDRCLSQMTTKEKEEKVLVLMKEYFSFTSSLEDKMKFSDILSIVNDNFVEKVSTIQLADYLKKLGLAKKRYNDGIYWYGVKVNKLDNKSDEGKNNIFNILIEN